MQASNAVDTSIAEEKKKSYLREHTETETSLEKMIAVCNSFPDTFGSFELLCKQALRNSKWDAHNEKLKNLYVEFAKFIKNNNIPPTEEMASKLFQNPRLPFKAAFDELSQAQAKSDEWLERLKAIAPRRNAFRWFIEESLKAGCAFPPAWLIGLDAEYPDGHNEKVSYLINRDVMALKRIVDWFKRVLQNKLENELEERVSEIICGGCGLVFFPIEDGQIRMFQPTTETNTPTEPNFFALPELVSKTGLCIACWSDKYTT